MIDCGVLTQSFSLSVSAAAFLGPSSSMFTTGIDFHSQCFRSVTFQNIEIVVMKKNKKHSDVELVNIEILPAN